MLEWLTSEIKSIATPKFHLVDGIAVPDFQETVKKSSLRLSSSYKEFVIKFGNSRFFRLSYTGYKLGVLAGPRRHPKHEYAYQIGFNDDEPIFMCEDDESVYGRDKKRLKARSFEAWLDMTYHKVKAQYSAEAWAEIEMGPRPFDEEELAVVNARKLFYWQDIGFNESKDRLLSIENGSDRTIPCLTLGVRSEDRRLNGAIILEVEKLSPGDKQIFAANCYKKLHEPSNLRLFNLPEPGPEDRPFLAELKRLRTIQTGSPKQR